MDSKKDGFIIPSSLEPRFSELDPMFSKILWTDIEEKPVEFWIDAVPVEHRILTKLFIDKAKSLLRSDTSGDQDDSDYIEHLAPHIYYQEAQKNENKGDYENAALKFNQAAHLYNVQLSSASAVKCLVKAAEMNVYLDKWSEAISLYEHVAETSLKHDLLRFSVHKYLFLAALCRMVKAKASIQSELIRYYAQFPSSSRREYHFLEAIDQACSVGSVEDFTTACRDYDDEVKLDGLTTRLLYKIKMQLMDAK